MESRHDDEPPLAVNGLRSAEQVVDLGASRV